MVYVTTGMNGSTMNALERLPIAAGSPQPMLTGFTSITQGTMGHALARCQLAGGMLLPDTGVSAARANSLLQGADAIHLLQHVPDF